MSAFNNTKILSNYSEIVDTSCENEKCITYIRANLERINNNPVDITTKIYEYQDKKYKCYTVGKEYSQLLALELDKLGAKYIVANIAGECKDPNELLVKNCMRLRINIKNTIY